MTLRLTLEIVPFGDEDKKYTIREINVSNLGEIDLGVCQYGVEVDKYKTKDYTTVVAHKRGEGSIKLVQLVAEALVRKGLL